MNTKQLKNGFFSSYNDFFFKNTLILSAPFLHSRTIGGEFQECLSIKQHIPLRLYIGLEIKSGEENELGCIKLYNPEDSSFMDYKISDYLSYSNIILNFINSPLFDIKGVRLNIFSEASDDVGLDFEYILSLLISHAASGKYIDTNRVFEKAFELSNQINRYPSSFPIIASFLNSGQPIVSKGNFEYELLGVDTTNISNKLDYIVVYSGISTKDHWILPGDITLSKSFPDQEQCDKDIEKGIGGSADNILSAINRYTYFGIKSFKNRLNENEKDEILRMLGRGRSFFHTFWGWSIHFASTLNTFIDNYNKNFGRIALIPHIKTLVGGCYTIVVPFNKTRHTLLEIVSDQLKNISPSSFLIYSSWQDGEEPEGLKVEQDLENGVFSEFVRKDLHILKMTDGSVLTGSFHELLDNESVDVILDADDKKVYVAGKKLTAKDITSQSTLVEIYEHFFKHSPSKTIRNVELPRSAFSREKNNMNGKLIIPFKKIIKTALGKTLPIKVTGTLTHFDLIFGDSDVRIGLLSKIGS